MKDSASGLEHTLENTRFSPIAAVSRLSPERMSSSPIVLGESHDLERADLTAIRSRAAQKQEAGCYAEAEQLCRQALQIADRALPAGHPDVVILLNDLTRLYLRQAAHDSAEPLLLRLLELKRSKGDDHPEVATVLASLASVRRAMGRHESAEELWRRVVDIRERTLAPNHFAIATALEQLGDSCAARGKIGEALTAFERALAIRELTLGKEHPSVRLARERITDLELQASDESLDATLSAVPARLPIQVRALGEIAGTGAAALTPTFQPSPALPEARHSFVLPRAFDDDVPEDEDGSDYGEPAMARSSLQVSSIPYLDALESVREELERPSEGDSLAERGKAALAVAVAFVVARKRTTSIAAAAVAVLLIALAGTSQLRGSERRAAADPTTVADPRQAATSAVPGTAGAANLTGNSAVASANPALMASAARTTRSQAPEDRGTPRRLVERQQEPKRIAIPRVSTNILSALDSVVVKTGGAAALSTESLVLQPAPPAIGMRRSTFLEPDQFAPPQRARLIGAPPQPKVPPEALDREGYVVVQFTVDPEGRPVMSTLAVLKSSNPILATAVSKVIPGMRFEPARSAGPDQKAVADLVEIPFNFTDQKRPRQ